MDDNKTKPGDDGRGRGVSQGAGDNVKYAHTVSDDDAAEDSDIHDPQVTPPEDHDEESFSGSNPSLTSDDNIDELGDEYGVEYDDDEELNMAEKVKIETEEEPPEKN